jgi:hypothetical protein
MSAELIAKVIADLRAGRIYLGEVDEDSGLEALNEDTTVLAQWATVVDSTEVWKRWMNDTEGRLVYETHRVCPPWENCFIAFVNSFNNVEVLSVRVIDIKDDEGMWAEKIAMIDHWESAADTHEIDWDGVQWIMHVAIYLGGMTTSNGEHAPRPVATHGPMHAWRIAVYPDGEIADINWIQLRETNVDTWDAGMMVLLDTFNMLNCVNVEIAEPHRPRAERRRLQRTGVTVHEIHVKPTSRSYRGIGTPLSAIPSSPLSSVRGHYAQYGPKYGRGLLFGKYEGRYWIPQHIRGSEILGVSEQEYLVEP